jgi:hypothetical protein
MKTSLTIVLVAAVMSVTTTGYAKLFNDEQLESLFQGEDAVFETSIKPSDLVESSVSDVEAAIQFGLRINLFDIIENKLSGGGVADLDSTYENPPEGCFEETAFNAGNFLELKIVKDNAALTKTNILAEADLSFCFGELSFSELAKKELSSTCGLMLLTIAR